MEFNGGWFAMNRIILAIAFLALTAFSAGAEVVHRIDIVQYGIYTATVEAGSRKVMNGLAHNVVTNIHHAVTTTTVPAQLGVHFGFRYRIVGSAPGRHVTLRKVTLFPPPGLKPPDAAKPMQRNEYTLQRKTGETSYTDYSFDHPWELIPGQWTLQLWEGNRKLAEKSFTVVRQ